MDIGIKIKNARINKGLTQEELGKAIGVQKSAIAKYENGRIVNIKRSTLKKLSDILEIPPFELVFDEAHQEMRKNNDAISDIILRLRTDKEFLYVVKSLNNLDNEKINSIKQMIDLIK